jgi:hypothetical protein
MKKPARNKAANKETRPVDVDPRFVPVVDAFAKDRRVTRGKMMSSYGLKVNGKLFAKLGRDQFVTKLPKERVDELVSGGMGERFDPGHGRLMKEWIVVWPGQAGIGGHHRIEPTSIFCQ